MQPLPSCQKTCCFSVKAYSLRPWTMMKSYPALPNGPWFVAVSLTRQQVACFKPAGDHTLFFSFLRFSLQQCISAVLFSRTLLCPSSWTACWGKWALRLLTWLPSMCYKVYVHTLSRSNTRVLFSPYSSLVYRSLLSTHLCFSVWFSSTNRTTLGRSVWMLFLHHHEIMRVHLMNVPDNHGGLTIHSWTTVG